MGGHAFGQLVHGVFGFPTAFSLFNFSQIGSDRPDSDSEPDLSRSPQREEDSDRLRHIEQMLHQQSAMLSELLQRVDQGA